MRQRQWCQGCNSHPNMNHFTSNVVKVGKKFSLVDGGSRPTEIVYLRHLDRSCDILLIDDWTCELSRIHGTWYRLYLIRVEDSQLCCCTLDVDICLSRILSVLTPKPNAHFRSGQVYVKALLSQCPTSSSISYSHQGKRSYIPSTICQNCIVSQTEYIKHTHYGEQTRHPYRRSRNDVGGPHGLVQHRDADTLSSGFRSHPLGSRILPYPSKSHKYQAHEEPVRPQAADGWPLLYASRY